MLRIIASNFLKIGNGWAMVVKYAATVVYLRNHFFPQFLENSRSHSNAYNNLISSKKNPPIKRKSDWWFYGKYVWYYWCPSELWEARLQWSDCIKRNWKLKVKMKIFKTSSLWLKIGVFAIFSYSFRFSVYFPVTWIALE